MLSFHFKFHFCLLYPGIEMDIYLYLTVPLPLTCDIAINIDNSKINAAKTKRNIAKFFFAKMRNGKIFLAKWENLVKTMSFLAATINCSIFKVLLCYINNFFFIYLKKNIFKENLFSLAIFLMFCMFVQNTYVEPYFLLVFSLYFIR